MEITVKPVETADELRVAHDMFATVHSADDYAKGLRWLENCGARYPGYSKEHTRIAVCRPEIVGGLRMITDTIRLGEARLKMGGLGWVTTSERHRNKGVCTRLMEDILAYMKRHRYHLSMLFGVPDLYHRWKYVTTLADYVIDVDTLEALTFQCPFQTRPAKIGDIQSIQMLHNANDEDMACSIVRTRAHLICKWDESSPKRVLMDDQGKVLAYFFYRNMGDHLAVEESGVADIGLCGSVLRACASIAEEESLAHLRIHCPPPHPMARYMLEFKSRHETLISRNSGGMLAFVDIDETFEHMIPEWERCVKNSGVHDLRTEATLIIEGAPYRVRANRGAIDIARVPGMGKVGLRSGEMMHLLTGYRHAEDILAAKQCLLSPDARALLCAIFPKRHPFVWPFDRF
ncbi:MAG TPA: GNAT family N-acetyltransferase [Candidatus Hydrogenedentes bacterium]|nr:GNAT family N-acetyltransferase [Candidatus Hydrogenedentota bacterium]HQH54282.1 GNAT family N-acetyltransferase [Candidatus Hydrogenedentota bacterium]